MTPKEKAKFLFDEYFGYVHNYVNSLDQNIFNAKQCALIAVDMIFEAMKVNNITHFNSVFWDEVKQEIENL